MNKEVIQWNLKEAIDAVLLAQNLIHRDQPKCLSWDELEIAFSHLKAIEEEVNKA